MQGVDCFFYKIVCLSKDGNGYYFIIAQLLTGFKRSNFC